MLTKNAASASRIHMFGIKKLNPHEQGHSKYPRH